MRCALIPMLALAATADEGRFFKKEYVDFWNTNWHAPKPAGDAARLLEEPTVENARAFLDAARARFEKIKRALEAIAEASPLHEVQGTNPPKGESRPRILYFRKKGCPACDIQDELMAGLNAEVVDAEDPRAERFGVTAFPTIFVGTKRFVGLTPPSRILNEK